MSEPSNKKIKLEHDVNPEQTAKIPAEVSMQEIAPRSYTSKEEVDVLFPLLKEDEVKEEIKDEEEGDEKEWPEHEWERIARMAARDRSDQICPYLDTIDRKVLDFDFEKLCSVSLSHLNTYACLVCGKYYQGRGKNSHAYFHALEADHHVFIHLRTEQIYCLPDNYEVNDSSLEDIKFNLHPKYTRKQIAWLETNKTYIHALDGTDYLPGVVGLNNIKTTDWLNVVVQALQRVTPLRNFMLFEPNVKESSTLTKIFSELCCQLWDPRRFKGHVSPHELLQAVSTASSKKYRIGARADPHEFFAWFLHSIHNDLTKGKKNAPSIITQCFQGELLVTTETPKKKEKKGKSSSSSSSSDSKDDDVDVVTATKKFLYLSLDLPTAPLFKDETNPSLIPQVPLFDLLTKFDGAHEEILADGSKRKYQLKKLPRYLILHIKRFRNNNWFLEKNPTLVNFLLKNLDLKQYKANADPPTVEELEQLPIETLLKRLKKRKVDVEGITDKRELAEKLAEVYDELKVPTKYDLVANICHEGKPEKGSYRVHIYHKPTDTWFELQDLHVWTTETMPQLVTISEAYIQIYELQQPK